MVNQFDDVVSNHLTYCPQNWGEFNKAIETNRLMVNGGVPMEEHLESKKEVKKELTPEEIKKLPICEWGKMNWGECRWPDENGN